MAWYWPFKKKTHAARNGGTVAATVSSPIEDVADHVSVAQTNLAPAPFTTVPAGADDYLAKQWPDRGVDATSAPNPVTLVPVDQRFKVGDRVLTVNGQHVWTVRSVAADYSSIVVVMTDTRGRQQVRRYEPYRLIRAHDGARGF